MRVKLQKPSRKALVPILTTAAMLIALAISATVLANQPKLAYVLVASKDLAKGEPIKPEDVQRVQLAIGNLAATYPTRLIAGVAPTHSLSKGQLIAKGDLERIETDLVPIRLNNLKPIPTAISVGDSVEIWATDLSPSSTASPEPIAFNALVTAIEVNNSMAQITTSVEVRVDRTFVESILAAVDSRFQLALILNETLADE